MAIVKRIDLGDVTDEHRTEFRSLRFDPGVRHRLGIDAR